MTGIKTFVGGGSRSSRAATLAKLSVTWSRQVVREIYRMQDDDVCHIT